MPVYWQMQKFSQHAIVLSENTIGDWINDTCRNLTAIYKEFRTSIIHSASGYIMADKTPFMIIDTAKRMGKKSHICYMWPTATRLKSRYFININGAEVANTPDLY